MYTAAGTNPQTSTVTKVTRGRAEQSTETGPMSIGDGKVRGEIELAGLVEGLVAVHGLSG
jgi:hypothetical protein